MVDDEVLRMHEELVDCSLIEELPVNKTVRSFSKEFVNNLAISLKEQGLYNPIAIRPNPEKPGWYILVQGRHRLHAWFKILKEQMIRATVLPVMDEKEAAFAAVAENLWRHEGTKAQKLKAVKIWNDYYAAKLDLAAGAAPPAAKLCGKSRKKTGEKSFVKQVQQATGLSERSAQYDVAMAKLFSTEQLDVFDQRGITQQQILKISQIAGPEKQQELISLIASGMKFQNAWTQMFNAPLDLHGSSKDERAAKAEAEAESDPELSDTEWMNTYCSEKLEVFGHPEKFKSDVILYREIAVAREKFRAATKAALKRRRDAGATGPLWGSIYRLTNICHPKDWFNCPDCGGSGVIKDTDKECPNCHKAGYALRSERYE